MKKIIDIVKVNGSAITVKIDGELFVFNNAVDLKQYLLAQGVEAQGQHNNINLPVADAQDEDIHYKHHTYTVEEFIKHLEEEEEEAVGGIKSSSIMGPAVMDMDLKATIAAASFDTTHKVRPYEFKHYKNGVDSNEDPTLTGATANLTEDGAKGSNQLIANGKVTSIGGDPGEQGFVAGTQDGKYGDLTIDSNGNWHYEADNSQSAIQGLKPGETLTEIITVTSNDGKTQTNVVITITGADDVPTLGGDSATITEDSLNGSDHLETSGKVSTEGGDAGEQGFVPGTETGQFGELTIDKDGNWTYEADNSQEVIQNLKPGETLTEIIKVTSSDGVTQTEVTITITGADDVPTLTPDTGSVTEDAVNGDGKLVTSGSVGTSGGDAGEQNFVPGTQTGTFGDLIIDANGNWTYEADNKQAVIQGLKPGETLTESFTVTNSDGVTTTTVTITINGADDVPDLTGDDKTITEDAVNDAGQLETSGKVSTEGGDAGEQGFVPGTETGQYGELTIDKDGNWTYEADNSQEVIQNLKPGETLTEIIKVTSSDGVTTTTVTITINGADDVPTLTPDTGSVTEDVVNGDGKLETSGTLTATGGDAGEQGFVPSTQTGTFGDLIIDANGNWTYEADNKQAVIQGLKPGETLTESFTVTNSDGVTTTTVTITINGADDVPDLTGDDKTITEDAVNDAGQLETSGKVSTEGGDAGEQGFVPGTETGQFGELTIDKDGNWTYEADNSQEVIQNLKPGETLTEIIKVTSSDGVTQTDVVITIVGSDDVPTLTPDTGSVTEDMVNGADQLETSGTVGSAGGDAGEQGFIPETKVGQYGELTIDENGNWRYLADNKQEVIQELKPGETLTEIIKVTSSDGVTQTEVTIIINGVDDVPVLTPDAETVTEDSVNDAGQLVANGAVTTTGGEDDEHGFIAETITGDFGDLTIDETGNWHYEADNSQKEIQDLKPGETLTDIITVTDSDGETQTQVTITITGSDDVPVLTDDAKTVIEDTTNSANQLETSGKVNATGGDAGEQSFIAESKDGLYGELTIDEDGNWHYLADNSQKIIQDLKPGETLTDIIKVTNSDGVTHSKVTITIEGVDDVPVLTGAASEVTEDTDVNGDGKLVTSGTVGTSGGDAGEQEFESGTEAGKYGNLVIGADGNWTYEADNSQKVIQDLKPGETLTENITVTSSDGVTKTVVTIVINGADDVPTFTSDVKTVTEDQTNGAADQLVTSGVVTAFGGDLNEQSFIAESKPGTYGQLTIDASGNWHYEADNGQDVIQKLLAGGETLTDSFAVMSSDGVSTTTVDIHIVGVDDVPVLTGSSSSVTEDTNVNGDGKLETTGTVGTSGGDAGEQGFVPGTQTGTFGDLTIDENGNWTYEADNTQEAIQNLKPGQTLTDTIKVTSSDGVTQTEVKITINGTDDVPVLTPAVKTVYEDDTNGAANQLVTSGVVSAVGGDFGEQSFKSGSQDGIYGKLTINDDGNWHYEADNGDPRIQALKEGESTSESFNVLSSDGVTTTTVTIIIQGNDTLPTLSGAADSVTEDMVNGANQLEVSGTVSATGGDAGDDSFMAGIVVGQFGNLTVGADGSWTYLADNSQKVIQDLKPGETLTDSITVMDSDGVSTTTVVITIKGTDDVPTLTPDEKTVTENQATGTSNQLVTSGVVTAVGGDTGEQAFEPATPVGKYGQLTIDTSGHWHYEADNGQDVIQGLKKDETLIDSFTVMSSDGVSTTTVVITIVGVDNVPVLSGSVGEVTEDLDPDGDDKLETSGKVTTTGGDAGEQGFEPGTQTGKYGDLVIDANGNWTYEADNKDPTIQALKPGETLTETITVTSSDGVTKTNVVITIRGADDIPVLTPDAATVTEDDTNGVNQLDTTGKVNATGGDAGEQSFKPETLTGTYGNLTIDTDGNWHYLADNSQKVIQDLKPGESLTDTIKVTSSDGVTQTDVVITIWGVDDVPTLTGSTGALIEDVDVNGDGKLVTSGTVGTSGGDAGEQGFMPGTQTTPLGELTIGADGNWTYKADNNNPTIQNLKPGETLTETITVTSSDGVTKTDVVITITGSDDIPVLTPDAKTVTEDTVNSANQLETSGKVTATGGDAGEQSFIAGTEKGLYGDLTINADGTWTYLADNSQKVIQDLKAGETMQDIIKVTSSDGVTQTEVVITIVGVDDVPKLTSSSGAVIEDTDVNGDGKLETSGTVGTSGGDAGEQGFVPGTQTGKYGDLVIGADGKWTYEADNNQTVIQQLGAGQTLTETIKVTSSDGVTQTDVVITITGVDDIPVLSSATQTVTEDVTNASNQLDASGKLLVSGGDGADQGFVAASKTGTYGHLTIDADGNWHYLADNSQKVIQDLKPTDSLVETFTVTNSDGVTTTTVTITINGADDVPVLSVGVVDVTEDTNVNADGNLEASGTLTASDGDAGEQGFKPESLTGTYGKLTIDDKGNWHYLVDNSLGAVQALPQGASMAEQFIVTSSDGVTQTKVDVVIHGVNDVPPIVGKDIGEVRDDSPEGMTSSGKLDVDDVDTGESAFRPQTAVEDDYGRFTINPDGTWSYELDPTKPAFTDIAENEHVEHEITVTTIDGTTKTITINILNPDKATGDYLTPGDDVYVSPDNEIDQIIIAENDKQFGPDHVYNISISLDVSGSMMMDVDTIKLAIRNAIDGIYSEAVDKGAQINLHLSTFGNVLTDLGSFDLTDPTAHDVVNAAIDKIVTDNGAEIYELSFKDSIDWFLTHPATDINQMVFITDGNPTIYDKSINVAQANFDTIYLNYDTTTDKLITLADLLAAGSLKSGDVIKSPITGAELGVISEKNGQLIYNDLLATADLNQTPDTWSPEYKQYVKDQSLHMNAILKKIATIEGISIDTMFGNGAANVPDYDSDGIVSPTITPASLAQLILDKLDFADRGSDTVSGGVGDDLIFGDLVITTEGDTLHGNDELFAYISTLSSTTISNSEDAFTYIYNNPEIFDMSSSKDFADTLSGDTGNDILFGQGGDDTLSGGQGEDILVGGKGSDTLTGGYDADSFVITSTSVDAGAKDTITDFNLAEGDVIDLTSMISDLKGPDMTTIINNISDNIKADVVADDVVLHITSDSNVTQDLVIKDGVHIFEGFDLSSSDTIVSEFINNHVIKTSYS
ncbi:MAG: VCBS domain-containing protein [Aeromonas sp.]